MTWARKGRGGVSKILGPIEAPLTTRWRPTVPARDKKEMELYSRSGAHADMGTAQILFIPNKKGISEEGRGYAVLPFPEGSTYTQDIPWLTEVGRLDVASV